MISRILSIGKFCIIVALGMEAVFLLGKAVGGNAFVFYYGDLQLGSVMLGGIGCLLYFFFGRSELEQRIQTFFRLHKKIYISICIVFGLALIPLLVQSIIAPWTHSAFLDALVPYLSTLVVVAGAVMCVVLGYEPKKGKKTQTLPDRNRAADDRWFRRPSWLSILVFILLACVAVLRFVNLGSLGYSTDEGSTALYASVIGQYGVPCLDGLCYLRGVPYLYVVAFFTQIFGVTEFWVRAPGIFASLLTAYLLYRLVLRLFAQKYIAVLTLVLVLFADWYVMLGRYARMYSVFLLFTVIALFAYQKAFFEGKKKYIAVLIASTLLAMVTHQFGLLLAFFILEPLFSGTYARYRDPWYVFSSLCILIAAILALTKLPSSIYTDLQYISIYDQYANLLVGSRFWYIRNLQSFDWTYLQQLFQFFPAVASLAFAGIAAALVSVRQNSKHLVSYFIVCVIIALAIYKIDYALKYVWWILALLQVPLAYTLVTLYKRYRALSVVIVIVLLLSSVAGVAHILTRGYGEDERRFPVLMSSHVEQYHPDDKTPVEYVASHYQSGDVIVTDYWMQDVYLFLALGRKSDFFVSRWDRDAFLNKFPYYKLYNDPVDDSWKMSRNGPVLIGSLDALHEVFETHRGRIWYITSSDFDRKPYLYISQKNIDVFVTDRFANNLVYTGQDRNSRVYLIPAAE